jgi:hypothetical protein
MPQSFEALVGKAGTRKTERNRRAEMKIESETIKVEELTEDRTFRVRREIVELMSPEELLTNHKNVEEYMKKMSQDLEGLDAQRERIKNDLERQLAEHRVRLEGLSQGINRAESWSAQAKNQNQDKDYVQ